MLKKFVRDLALLIWNKPSWCTIVWLNYLRWSVYGNKPCVIGFKFSTKSELQVIHEILVLNTGLFFRSSNNKVQGPKKGFEVTSMSSWSSSTVLYKHSVHVKTQLYVCRGFFLRRSKKRATRSKKSEDISTVYRREKKTCTHNTARHSEHGRHSCGV